MRNILELIQQQHIKRARKENSPAIKINLYKNYEVFAIKEAISELLVDDEYKTPDCFMIGDSYLTTHLFKRSTRFSSDEERGLFINILLNSIFEVKTAIIKSFYELQANMPYLISDIPDGATKSDKFMQIIETMIDYGADAVKLEISSYEDLNYLSQITHKDIPVIAHIGFTPQNAENRRYGTTIDEVLWLFSLARQARNNGACAIVLERVDESINQSLCELRVNSLPVYSIFSGKAKYGGQSLNVWDSVYQPESPKLFFPKSAKFDTKTYPYTYSNENIKECFKDLLSKTIDNSFPLSPRSNFSKDEKMYIQSINPWEATK